MNSAYELNTVYIKNSGVTDQELAVVAERASELPGVFHWHRLDTRR